MSKNISNEKNVILRLAQIMAEIEPSITIEDALGALGKLPAHDVAQMIKAYEDFGEEKVFAEAKSAHKEVYGEPSKLAFMDEDE